jgi:hypothetical protein
MVGKERRGADIRWLLLLTVAAVLFKNVSRRSVAVAGQRCYLFIGCGGGEGLSQYVPQ